MPIPEWYHPIPDADPDAFTQAVDLQLGLAQRVYDPTGTFAQQREADWIVHASQDTRGVKSLPAIYQSEATSITVGATADEEGAVRLVMNVRTDRGTSSDTYSTHVEEELPIIVALLGKIARVELAEFEAHPRRVISAIAASPGSSIGMERNIAQKTLELPDTPGGAINVTYFKMTGSMGTCDARLARQVALPEGTFLYEQNIIRDDRNPDVLYCWPRAFMLSKALRMGKAYQGTHIKGEQLVNGRPPGESRMSDFEAMLRQAGNAVVGIAEMTDVSRLVSEPLSRSYRLHA